jgi:subtilisin family serine protease
MPTPRKPSSRRVGKKSASAARGSTKRVTAAGRRAANTEPGTGRTIVYVHGIGNKPLPAILKCQWDHALFGFDLAERSRLAYWVNRAFYPDPSEGTCASPDSTQLEDEPTGRAISVRQHVDAVSLDDEITAIASRKTDRETLLAIAAKMEAKGTPPEVGTKAVEGLAATALPLPRPLREWITRRIVRAFLRDVNDYFYVPARRAAMKESVLERIRVGGGPFVVIGHSQGSMIAYDVLCDLDPAAYPVELFVTVGSPLGITEVQDQIRSLTGQKSLRVPRCIKRWINVADAIDPVALDSTLAGEFMGPTSIQDFTASNPDAPRHPHSGSGYLRTEVVQTAVRNAVETAAFQPIAPFVIARDMARRFENQPAEVRHKVLIELASTGNDSKGKLDATRENLVASLKQIARDRKVSEEALAIDPLQRFVAAELTREEAETLASVAPAAGRSISRIWRNSAKSALLDTSTNTIQARTANVGYSAVGRDIRWAVLDTGVNAAHPHFARFANIQAQYDCTKRGALITGSAPDNYGHGTHVAGIIAGTQQFRGKKGKPDRVMSGVAPEAKLHIYKTLGDDGDGDDSWIIKALDHLFTTNEGAGQLVIHGVNLSLGGSFDQSVYACGHSPLCRELKRLWRQGVVVVLAAGNEGFAVLQTLDGTIDANMDLSIGDPANLEEAIAVGSVHKESPHTFGISYFSSRGPTADGRQKPDVVAPGERILSCRHKVKKAAATVDDLYVEMSGTSMATPHVSGVAAAFLSVRREFVGEPDRVKQILIDNCTDLKRVRTQQGAGLVNLTKMLLNT